MIAKCLLKNLLKKLVKREFPQKPFSSNLIIQQICFYPHNNGGIIGGKYESSGFCQNTLYNHLELQGATCLPSGARKGSHRFAR